MKLIYTNSGKLDTFCGLVVFFFACLKILNLLKYNLLQGDYQGFTAKNGLVGINITEREIPHLIILDVRIPKLDGVETCHRLRAIPSY